jgi:hypothetical protein
MKQFIGFQSAIFWGVMPCSATEVRRRDGDRSTRSYIQEDNTVLKQCVVWNNRKHLPLQKSEFILWNNFDQSCRPLHWMKCVIFLFALSNISKQFVLNNVLDFLRLVHNTVSNHTLLRRFMAFHVVFLHNTLR